MGKKVKKKAKSGQKDKRGANASPKDTNASGKTVVSESFTNTASTNVVVKERRVCPHLDKGIDLERVSAKLKSSEPLRCEDCREEVDDRRAGKGKGKQGRSKGGTGSKSESRSIWVCLDCGHFSCGGAGFPTTPQNHAVRHARQHRHPLAAKFENPQLRWCFPCNTIIPLEKSEDDGGSKDALHDIVKLIKGKSETSAADVEDVWFGSGSVTNRIKSENCSLVDSDVSGGYMVRGLTNLGNTCFFNSVMQNLLAVDRLRHYFLELEGSLGPVTASLKKLIMETSPEAGLTGVINPRSFFGCICVKCPQFQGFQQHDGHELLRCLLDTLCTEELSARKQLKISQEEGKSPETGFTFVDAIFGGQLSSTVSCLECGHSSRVFEPFLDLSLPVPTNKPPSRKAQPVSRAKKPKPPPKRSGRIRPKANNDANVVQVQCISDQSTGGKSSSHVQPIIPVADQTLTISDASMTSETSKATTMNNEKGFNSQDLTNINVEFKQGNKEVSETLMPAEDSTWLDFLAPGALSNDKVVSSEISNSLADHGLGKENGVPCNTLMQGTLESGEDVMPEGTDAALGSDNLTWLDFCGPGKSSDSDDMGSRVNDESISEDSKITDAVRRNVVFELNQVSCGSVSFNGSNVEDELPLQAQDSAVILLPNTDDSSKSEILREEGEVSSSAILYDENSPEFDGFGGLFDQSEATVESIKSSEANAATRTGAVVGNCSESEPDEVDSANSQVSVESCLSYFIRAELLSKDEHAWQCENCSKVLREQKLRSKKSLQKHKSDTVINGCEVENSNLRFSTGENQPISIRLSNVHNGIVDKDILDSDDASQLSHNALVDNENNGVIERIQKAELNGVASKQEDGKHERRCSCYNPSFRSDKLCYSESQCSENKESDNVGRNSDSVQLVGSESVAVSCQSEGSEDEIEAEHVKVTRDATKRIYIDRAPPILTIHLKRFRQDARGRLSKLNGHVGFRDIIDLKPYVDPRCKESDQYKYRLLGVVEHLGTMRGGHYVAYVRGGIKSPKSSDNENENFRWYHASDAYIREATLDEVLRCDAYILFYEQI